MAANLLETDPIASVPLARRNGLDPDAVRDLLMRLTQERDEALERGRDNHRDLGREREEKSHLERELEALRREVGPLRERETAVGEALVTANTVARGVREEAQREAERTLSEARAEAERILSEARAEADRTLREAAVQAATMGEETRSRIAALRDEGSAAARTARDIAITLRDMAGTLERTADTMAGPEVPAMTFGEEADPPAGEREGGVAVETPAGEEAPS